MSTVPSGVCLSGVCVLPSQSGGGRCQLEEDLIKRGCACKMVHVPIIKTALRPGRRSQLKSGLKDTL